jgi:CBS domain-containing protein
MNPRVEALRITEKVLPAVHWLVRRGYSAAPVVADQGQLVGVLSEYDCIEALMHQVAEGTPDESVADCMTKDVHTVREDELAVDVGRAFLRNRSRRVFVVDANGGLRGLISRRDLLRTFEDFAHQTDKVSTYDILNRMWR